jgi:hypothetical protein
MTHRFVTVERWGRSDLAQNNHNPFGATPNRPLTFGSPSEAWDWWGNTWGGRVDGTGSDTSAFLDRLRADNRNVPDAVDPYGAYNSEDPDWKDKVEGVIRSVRRRLPQWQHDAGP